MSIFLQNKTKIFIISFKYRKSGRRELWSGHANRVITYKNIRTVQEFILQTRHIKLEEIA